jgi:hypothetical protein
MKGEISEVELTHLVSHSVKKQEKPNGCKSLVWPLVTCVAHS